MEAEGGEEPKRRKKVKKTIENINNYVEDILADYPYFPERAKSFLAEELTALQCGYFALCPEVVAMERTLQSDLSLPLSSLSTETGRLLNSEEIVAVFLGGKELPKRQVLQFYRSNLPGFTVEEDRIVCRVEDQSSDLTILFAQCPKDITYSAETGYTGEICISKTYLPIVSARLRELIARLSGEEEDADHFADCYNAWLVRLKEERGGG